MAGPPPTSPRTNLARLLRTCLGEDAAEGAELQAQMQVLMKADAENKVANRKLYLILDLDETLVFSQRLKPGATPAGHLINVRDQPFDMVLRPGLLHFLQVIRQTYVVFMYTMGDDYYTHAVLDVIDPQRQLFAGGVCCWRHPESRDFKFVERVACEKSMAVVVDDSIDVWRDALPNLCLTRRFVGDPMDDGLQLLSWQLQQVHRRYYAAADDAAPTVPRMLGELRGGLLQGCTIAFTGLVMDQSEEVLATQPLCELVRLYGAAVTLEVDDATHLVARKKEGWKGATKIRRALQRQETDPSFRAVWDHWLLDSICSFKRQSETNYAVRMDEEEVEYIVPGRLDAANNPGPPAVGAQDSNGGARTLDASLEDILGAVTKTTQTQMRVQPVMEGLGRQHAVAESPGVSLTPTAPLPPRKRPRDDEPPQVPKAPDREISAPTGHKLNGKMSVAEYLRGGSNGTKTVPSAR